MRRPFLLRNYQVPTEPQSRRSEPDGAQQPCSSTTAACSPAPPLRRVRSYFNVSVSDDGAADWSIENMWCSPPRQFLRSFRPLSSDLAPSSMAPSCTTTRRHSRSGNAADYGRAGQLGSWSLSGRVRASRSAGKRGHAAPVVLAGKE